jgi:hypothetical protein
MAADTRSQYRAREARIWSAVFVQPEGRGFSFQVPIQSRMSFSRALTLVCAPRLIFFSVSSPNQRSTMLSHEPEVGVKWRWNRGRRSNHRLISGVLWVA